MKKAEARNIAINFLQSEALIKHPIDDRGTLSKEGYTHEDYELIEREIDFIVNKLEKLKLKQ